MNQNKKVDYIAIVVIMIILSMMVAATTPFPTCDKPRAEDGVNLNVITDDGTVPWDGKPFEPTLTIHDDQLRDAATIDIMWNDTIVGAVYGDTNGNFIRAWATCESGEPVRMECGR